MIFIPNNDEPEYENLVKLHDSWDFVILDINPIYHIRLWEVYASGEENRPIYAGTTDGNFYFKDLNNTPLFYGMLIVEEWKLNDWTSYFSRGSQFRLLSNNSYEFIKGGLA